MHREALGACNENEEDNRFQYNIIPPVVPIPIVHKYTSAWFTAPVLTVPSVLLEEYRRSAGYDGDEFQKHLTAKMHFNKVHLTPTGL